MLILGVLIALERWHTYDEPLERDTAGYAVIAHELLHGRLLYSDLWERKPPLVYATFAAAELIVGYGRQEIFLLNVLAGWATLLGIFVAGRRVGRGRNAGLIGAALWAILCGDMYGQANQPNTEVFINACLTWAFALLVHWPVDRRYRAALMLGLLFAAATLFKHHLVVVCLIMMGGHLMTAITNPKAGRSTVLGHRLGECAISCSMIVVAWGFVIGYFAMTHRLDAMVDVLFRQNASYAGNLWHNLADVTRPTDFGGRAVWWTIAPLGLILAGLTVSIFRLRLRGSGNSIRESASGRDKNSIILWFAWAIGTWTAIALPGQFFPHYYQLAMPVLIIAAAWGGETLLAAGPGIGRLIGRLAVAAGFIFAIAQQLKFYQIPGEQWADAKDFGNFSEQYRLADRMRATLRPGETFWNFGQDTTLYFATGQSPPTGLIYLDPLKSGPNTGQYWHRLMNQLNETRPDLIVLTRSQYWTVGTDTPVFPWMDQNYETVGVDPAFPSYALLVRKDSELRNRLRPR